MRKSSDIERQILEAAKQLFIENSFDNVSTSDIAKKAGVSRTLLAYYFFNKDFLYEKTFENVMAEFTQKTEEDLSPDLSLSEIVKTMIDTHFDIFFENPKTFIFILSYLHRSKKEVTALNPSNGLYNFNFYTKLLSEKFKKGTTYQLDPTNFFINLISLISYPFTMQRFISANHNFDDSSFKEFMLQRKEKILNLMLLSVGNNDNKPVPFQSMKSDASIN